MPIKIAGNVNVDAPRQEVWDSLFDLDVMRNVTAKVPGVSVERLDQIDDMHYEGTAVIGVAAIKGKYDGTITVLEKREPEFIRIKGEGKGGGNWTSGEVNLNLAEEDGKTMMSYAGQGNLSGPLASLGQRLVDTVGRQFIDQGAKAFAGEIGARHLAMVGAEAGIPVTPVPSPAAPVGEIAFAVLMVLLIAVLVIALSVPR